MNLTEAKEKLLKEIETLTNQLAETQISLSFAKTKFKKLEKAIKQAEEALK
jgi:peptidoglycan hydrolase CwlO-like protein